MKYSPIFTFRFFGICGMAFLFILTEQWMTHDAVEFENRFWTFMAFLLSTTCILTCDSPLRFPSHLPTIYRWFAIIICTFLAHNFDRHLRRLVLLRVPNIKRIQSAEFPLQNRLSAHEKVEKLRSLMNQIDLPYISSTFLNIFFLPRVLYVERSIITIFNEANTDELNLIVSIIELARIFYKIKDHRIANQFHRSNLLKLLTIDRINELHISGRVLLINGLQKMKLSAEQECEFYVKNIILSTKENDLSELKCLADSKGDFDSFHKLIYKDIRNKSIKKAILNHIAKQANIQKAHSTISSRSGRKRNKYAWKKIVSDVDDTLSCSGGSWPAGIDTSYPKKAVYPGILSFYRELDLGTSGNDEWDNTRIGNLALLSARPHIYKDFSENATYNKIEKLRTERGLYTCPTLLAGSLDTGSKFVVNGDFNPIATKKFENYVEYFALYPEFNCIFIGDNGQGDVRTAEMILDSPDHRDQLSRVYIHQVKPLHQTYTKYEKTRQRQSFNNTKTSPKTSIFYFNTYIEAAIDAYNNKLILPSGLKRILIEAIQDFEYINIEDWNETAENLRSLHQKQLTTKVTPFPKLEQKDSFFGVNGAKSEIKDNSTLTAGITFNNSNSNNNNNNNLIIENNSKIESEIGNLIAENDLIISNQVSNLSSPLRLISKSTLFPTPPNNNSNNNKDGKDASSRSNSANNINNNSNIIAPTSSSNTASRLSNRLSWIVSSLSSTQNNSRYYHVCRHKTILEVENTSGEMKREARLRELNGSIRTANAILNDLNMEVVKCLNYTQMHNIGTVVKTFFGRGVVTAFRPDDGIYTVDIDFGATVSSNTAVVNTTTSTSSAVVNNGINSSPSLASSPPIISPIQSSVSPTNSINNNNNNIDNRQSFTHTNINNHVKVYVTTFSINT
eukprot:gene4474-6325_t